MTDEELRAALRQILHDAETVSATDETEMLVKIRVVRAALARLL